MSGLDLRHVEAFNMQQKAAKNTALLNLAMQIFKEEIECQDALAKDCAERSLDWAKTFMETFEERCEEWEKAPKPET